MSQICELRPAGTSTWMYNYSYAEIKPTKPKILTRAMDQK